MTDPIRAETTRTAIEATLSEVDGRWMLRMARDLAHPVDRVWAKLIDPTELARWSPFVPDRPLTTLGPATARETPTDDPVDAEVLVLDPPRELVHRWGGDLLRWRLTETPDGTRLTLEHVFDPRGECGMYAAGWHIVLAVLTVQLAGHAVDRVVGARAKEYDWSGLREAYDRQLLG